MASTSDPEDWFLENITFSSKNRVTPLIDGQNYYKELLDIFESNSDFNHILISGWRLNKDTIIDNNNNITFENLLETQLGNNNNFSKLKSMLWYVPGSIGDFGSTHGEENSDFTNFIVNNGGQAILDNRLPKGRFASHHQKYIIVDGADIKAAFIGGLDIAPDRLDSRSHDNSIPRMEENFKAWHDVQVKIEGPAVSDAMKLFQERWNDPRQPNDIPFAAGSTTSELTSIPEISGTIGSHHVQLLKTYPCKSNNSSGGQDAYPFAQGGDYTYQNALIKAIKNAEHYIYIEDQYCWPSDVVNELANAVSRDVAIMLVLARDFDAPGVTPYHNFLRNQAIELIKKSNHSETELVFVYHLEQDVFDPESQKNFELFVHSKVMIIDDRYMVIGSGNLNRRSMKTDTELGAAIVDDNEVASSILGKDENVSVLARDFRKSLWSEHLGISAIDDPFDADGFPAGFPKAGELIGHTRRHSVAQPRFCDPSIIPFALFNSNVTC